MKKANRVNDLRPNDTNIAIPLEIKFVIFYKEASEFGIYLGEDTFGNKITLKGFWPKLNINAEYIIIGDIEQYKGDMQIDFNSVRSQLPTSKEGIVKYLTTLKSIGEKRANEIYEEFEAKSIEILKNDPRSVSDLIEGISEEKAIELSEYLKENELYEYGMKELLSFELTPKRAKKLIEVYGEKIVWEIKNNPYKLSSYMGFSFKECDDLAKKSGVKPDDDIRIEGAILYSLKQNNNEGDCYTPKNNLINNVQELVNIEIEIKEVLRLYELYRNDVFNYEWSEETYSIKAEDLKKTILEYKNESDWHAKNEIKHTVFKVNKQTIEKVIKQLQKKESIYIENIDQIECVYRKNVYKTEKELSENIKRIIEWKGDILEREYVKKELDIILNEKQITLEKEQYEACINICLKNSGFDLLLGNAGTGKTFVLNIVLLLKEKLNEGINPLLLAPTGKASKIMARSTGKICKTIHRGLIVKNGEFKYNKENKLPNGLVVVDEASMLDLFLSNDLLNAIITGAQVIFMGDTKQLASVRLGNVLKDMIESNVVDIHMLKSAKRQSEKSGIIKNANHIINNEMPQTCEITKDAYVLRRNSENSCIQGVIDLIGKIMIKGYKLEDIQVLVPQKSTVMGVNYLNYLLQKIFNKENKNEMYYKSFTVYQEGREVKYSMNFKVGDKIINTRNNYETELFERVKSDNALCKEELTLSPTDLVGVMNGDNGIIVDIKEAGDGSKSMIVKYEDLYAQYSEKEVEDLDLAYALTIHKSQGSEWPVVIMPMMNQYSFMLENNIVYTGLTRAREMICVIGNMKTLYNAIQKRKSIKRNTGLKYFLNKNTPN